MRSKIWRFFMILIETIKENSFLSFALKEILILFMALSIGILILFMALSIGTLLIFTGGVISSSALSMICGMSISTSTGMILFFLGLVVLFALYEVFSFCRKIWRNL
jgi:hypothetical protein